MLGPVKPWQGQDHNHFLHPTKATLPTHITEEYMTFQRNHMTQYGYFWWSGDDYEQGIRGYPKQSYLRRAIEEEVNIVNTSRVRKTVFIEKNGAYQEIAPEPNFGAVTGYYQGEHPRTFLLPIDGWEEGFELEIGIRQANLDFDINISWEDQAYLSGGAGSPYKILNYNFTGEIEINPVSSTGLCFLEPKEKSAWQSTLHTHKNYSHRKWWGYSDVNLPYEGYQYYRADYNFDYAQFHIVKLYEKMDGTYWTGKTYTDFIGWFFQVPRIRIGAFDLHDTDDQQSNYFLQWNSTKGSEYGSYYASASEIASKEFDVDVSWKGSTYPMTFCVQQDTFHLFPLQSFSGSGSMDFEFFDQSAIQ